MKQFSIFSYLLKLLLSSFGLRKRGAGVDNPPSPSPLIAKKQFPKLVWTICFIAVFGTAVFFRLWQLDSIPPGLYPDVAMNGTDAVQTLKTGAFKVFYPENNGREGLFIWLTAFSFLIFGISVWSIKIVAAIFGILTVFGLYLLAKELFLKQDEKTSKYIALLSAYFMAVSFWHVNFSRLGFRAILLPFVLVFAFYFLFKGLRINLTKSPRIQELWNFAAAGIFFGLGFYTYTSFRLAALLLAIILICWFFIYQKQKLFTKFKTLAVYFLLVVFLIALPLGIYFIFNPGDFFGRMLGVSIFEQKNILGTFGESLVKHLAMFNIYGDSNWRHNYPGSPELFWPIGILFLIGFFAAIKKLVLFIKNRDSLEAPVYCLLVSWFFIMLLPGALTIEGIPHALRTFGVIPAIYILAGLGGWKTYEFLEKNIKYKKALFLASALFLLTIGFAGFNKYFIQWAESPEVKDAFTTKYAEIGYYLNSLPEETKKYVVVNEPQSPLYGISIPGQTPMFLEYSRYGRLRTNYVRVEDLGQISMSLEKIIIIPLHGWQTWVELFNYFPQGEFKIKNGVVILEIQ